MKVAVYHNLPSGGAKKALYYLLNQLYGSSHTIDVYSLQSGKDDLWPLESVCNKYSDYSQQLNETISPFAFKFAWGYALRKLDALQQSIASDIDGKGYDVVFVNNCHLTQSPLIIRWLQTPVVFYAQEPRRIDYEYNLASRRRGIKSSVVKLRNTSYQNADVRAIQHADLVLCNSYYSMESFKRAYGVNADVCYLGIDASLLKPVSKPTRDYILCVGAIETFKNQLRVVEAISLIAKSSRPILHLVYDRYDSVYKQRVIAAAKESGVSVKLLYRVSDEGLQEQFANALATICVADLEPFGFTPLESMACGTPAIAQKEGGYRETVTEDFGILLADRESNTLAVAIEELQSGKRQFGGKLLRYYIERQWSWKKTGEIFEGYLQKAAREKA